VDHGDVIGIAFQIGSSVPWQYGSCTTKFHYYPAVPALTIGSALNNWVVLDCRYYSIEADIEGMADLVKN